MDTSVTLLTQKTDRQFSKDIRRNLNMCSLALVLIAHSVLSVSSNHYCKWQFIRTSDIFWKYLMKSIALFIIDFLKKQRVLNVTTPISILKSW